MLFALHCTLQSGDHEACAQGNEPGTATERTRTSITSSLKRKLAEMLDEFTALRSSIMQQYRDVVERRFYTVTGDQASEEQIDNLIETGEAENLFQKAILAQGRGRVRLPTCFFVRLTGLPCFIYAPAAVANIVDSVLPQMVICQMVKEFSQTLDIHQGDYPENSLIWV